MDASLAVKPPRAPALCLLALLLAAAGAGGQEYGESVDVNVVIVDVEVRDAGGRQVTDLERGDFQVFEDGKRVKVDYYARVVGTASVPSNGRKPATETPARRRPTPPAGSSSTSTTCSCGPGSRRQALEHPRRRFREAAPGEQVMVASQDDSFRVRLPFSADRTAIDAALAALDKASRPTAATTTASARRRSPPSSPRGATPPLSTCPATRASWIPVEEALTAFGRS